MIVGLQTIGKRQKVSALHNLSMLILLYAAKMAHISALPLPSPTCVLSSAIILCIYTFTSLTWFIDIGSDLARVRFSFVWWPYSLLLYRSLVFTQRMSKWWISVLSLRSLVQWRWIVCLQQVFNFTAFLFAANDANLVTTLHWHAGR